MLHDPLRNQSQRRTRQKVVIVVGVYIMRFGQRLLCRGGTESATYKPGGLNSLHTFKTILKAYTGLRNLNVGSGLQDPTFLWSKQKQEEALHILSSSNPFPLL